MLELKFKRNNWMLRIKNSLLGLLVLGYSSIHAQNNLDSVIHANKDKFIKVSLLEGEWESLDTFHNNIQFKVTKYDVHLLPKVHINPFSFNLKDSTTLSAKGMALNWPPYDCVISYISEKRLDIIYYDFMQSPPAIYSYKRKKTN